MWKHQQITTITGYNNTNWDTAYTNRITSLTTTGSSGSATLASNVLNIPTYTLSGLGGQPQLNGTGFVKASGTTISYDNSTYLTAAITSLGGLTGAAQTFGNDTNVTMVSSGTTHTLTWSGTLADSRIASASTWNAKIGGSGTTNQIAYFTATSTIGSLTTATYPSLTELSYVKGVTSAIQTQLNSLNQYDDQFAMYQDVGSAIVTGTYGLGIDRLSAAIQPLADGQISFMLVRFRKADTILGVKWLQGTQGNYTADNYNGVCIGTLSSGTITIQAISTNDGNIWKGTANTWQTKAFTSGYAVSANTTYVIGIVYNNSAQVTLPTIYGSSSTSVAAAQTADFTNSVKLYGSKVGVSSITVGDTHAWSGLTGSNILPMFFPYK